GSPRPRRTSARSRADLSGRAPACRRLAVDVWTVASKDKAVFVSRLRHGNQALADVFLDPLEVALERVSVTTTTRGDDSHDVSFSQIDVRELAVAGDAEGLTERRERLAAVAGNE